MSFLSIKKVRLDSKECLQVKIPQPKDPEESEGISSSINEKIKGDYGKENAEKQQKPKAVIGEKIWRPPRQGQNSRLKSLTVMSPVATNTPTESSAFPKLIAIDKDVGKANEIENGILTIKRSSSAPGCTYVQTRVTKHKFRLPCIPDLKTLSITQDQPIKTLVVEGKKLGSAGEQGSTPDSSDNSNDLPKSDIKVVIEDHSDVQAKKLTKQCAVDDVIGVKERFHGDSYGDSFPSIKKTEFRVKSAYANSSKKFNNYLQSRFGKSVYESRDQKTGTGAGKKYHVYWAPVLIKKKMLYNRPVDANSTRAGGEEKNSVKDCSKNRKIHFVVSTH